MCPVFYGYLLEKIIKMRFNRIFADEQRTSDLVIRRAVFSDREGSEKVRRFFTIMTGIFLSS